MYGFYLMISSSAEKSAVAAPLADGCTNRILFAPDVCVFLCKVSKFNHSYPPKETFWNVFGGPLLRVPYIVYYNNIDHYNSTMSTHIVFRRRRVVSTPSSLYNDIPSALTVIRRRRRAAILKLCRRRFFCANRVQLFDCIIIVLINAKRRLTACVLSRRLSCRFATSYSVMRAAATVARACSPDWFEDPLGGGAVVRLPASTATASWYR